MELKSNNKKRWKKPKIQALNIGFGTQEIGFEGPDGGIPGGAMS